MKKLFMVLLLFGQLLYAEEIIKTAILGLGGRAQSLLYECLQLKEETGKELKIVAVCDDYAFASLSDFTQRLGCSHAAKNYKHLFAGCAYYPDTPDGLQELFQNHPTLDRILITSANHRHFDHLNAALDNSTCQNIFIEKPLFRNLDEFKNFASKTNKRQIAVGLTLRYSNMTRIVTDTLKQYQPTLGKLQKVKAWEHIGFAHAFTMIMMNWRRYHSLSGGLLIEKSVHDLDLALTFMQAAGAIPEHLAIKTKSAHALFKKSNHQLFYDCLTSNFHLSQNVAAWDTIPWQRTISFSYDSSGSIDWKTTLNRFFAEFPPNDDFSKSDIIPDEQKLMADITTTAGDHLDFELNVTLSSGQLTPQRGLHLFFEKGQALIDVVGGTLRLKPHRGRAFTIDLQTNSRSHAGGDLYVAHTILGSLPAGQHKALLHDPAVQLSSLMGLISEYQAKNRLNSPIHLTQKDHRWTIDFPNK